MRIGAYVLGEPIGRGGMGRVYRARDSRMGRDVALKVIAPEHGGSEALRRQFDRELRILAKLQHPGIVAVHDVGEVEDAPWYVMDLVEGASLDRVLARIGTGPDGAPDPRQVRDAIGTGMPPGGDDLIDPASWWRTCARIAAAICKAVEAAHGQGVLHRDLKPKNVMVLGGGRPVVLDFGLAGPAGGSGGEGGVTGDFAGTPSYLAPEQVRAGRIGADPATDIYQLGLILYEMLTLRRAFDGPSPHHVLRRIEDSDFELPHRLVRDVPRDLEAVCLKAMARAPTRRFATARELREDLERFLADTATVARPPGVLDSLARFVRRHRLAVAAIALIGAGIGAGAIAFSGEGGVGPAPAMQTLAVRLLDADRAGGAGGSIVGLTLDAPIDAEVRVTATAWLAVFTATRSPDGAIHVWALTPRTAEEVAAVQAARAAGLASPRVPRVREWPAGTHALNLGVAAELTEAGAEDSFWMFESATCAERLSLWADQVGREAGPEGVPLARFARLFEEVGDPLRSGAREALDDLPRDQLERMVETLRRHETLSELRSWTDPRFTEVPYRVVPEGE